MRSFKVCTADLCGWLNQDEGDGCGMWNAWGERRGAYRTLVGILKEGGHLEEDLGRDENTILKLILTKLVGRVWTGLICLSKVTSGRLGFCKCSNEP